jgi:hypothetical protein
VNFLCVCLQSCEEFWIYQKVFLGAKAKAKRVFAFQTGVSRFIFLVGSKRILIYFDFFEQVGKKCACVLTYYPSTDNSFDSSYKWCQVIFFEHCR